MVQWLILILAYDFAVLKFSLAEVTLSLRLLHYKNRNGLTYENRPCDTRLEHDINEDGRCDTGFLFCLVNLPFRNPHNCTLGDYLTGFVGADDIHFVNIDQQFPRTLPPAPNKQQRSSHISLWFQPTIYFRFPYPQTGIGLIVEVFDIDDKHNQTIHDSVDFYGRTLLDLKLYRSRDMAQQQRIYLRSLFGSYTNLTADFSFYCSPNYYGADCESYCLPNEQRYACDSHTGQKLCKQGYIGPDCLSDVRACAGRPCLNNGTCVVYLRDYLCQCPKGFTGKSCESVFSTTNTSHTCDRTTCIHGECASNGKCVCYENWTSKHCDQRVHSEIGCANRPCLHNSTCENILNVDLTSTYRCHCRTGYTGRNCEVEIVTACERTPCVHGRCIKVNLYTELCICEPTWIGVDCSQALSTQPMTSRKPEPVTSMSIIRIPAIKSIEHVSDTPIVTDLSSYFDWFKASHGPRRSANASQTNIQRTTKEHSPCASTPCLHNSTCVVQSEHSFQCVCSPSFIGIFCEIEILTAAHFQTNPCESSPCQHQSICITKSNHDVHCICRPRYKGKYCEHAPLSASESKCTRSCHNGGVCSMDEFNQQHCICKSSFTGSFCELSKNNCNGSSCLVDPCASDPCLSNGTCYSSGNYSCACPEQYTGERCEFDLQGDAPYAGSRDTTFNHDESNPTEFWPLAVVFGYVFSLMLVFIIIWFLWYGLTARSQQHFRSDIPYAERTTERFPPYRLGVSNPIFFTNQDLNTDRILKTFTVDRHA